MKPWKISLAALSAVALVAVAHAGLSGDGGGLHEHFARWFHDHSALRIDAHLDAMAARLELTTQQKKQVASTVRTALPELERHALALATAHAEQVEMLRAPELDEAAVRAAAVRIGAAEGDLAVDAARLVREVHGMLTPEQLDRAAAWHRPDLVEIVTEHVRGASQGLKAWADRQ